MAAVDFVAAVVIADVIDGAGRRTRAEFLELPGMRLTPTQVQRLAGVDGLVCARALDELVKSGLLRRDTAPSGRYRF